MHGYVYLTTNTLTNEVYVGQHHGPFTDKYIGTGKRLKEQIRQYGKSVFKVELLQECCSDAELDQVEAREIRARLGQNCLNIVSGRGHAGMQYSDELKSKISASNIGKHTGSRQGHSEASKEKCRQTNRISHGTEAMRKWHSEQAKGRTYIHKDGVVKFVKQYELDSWLQLGWLRGKR